MRRSATKIMANLIKLIYPMMHVMVLAIITGVLGFIASISITILGGLALTKTLGFTVTLSIKSIFTLIFTFALLRGGLRYIEQLSNHYLAFKLLAVIRNKVFTALRRLSPAKLEGRDKGNLISIITSDIELLEVFYAHTISPIAIASLTSLVLVIFIGFYHPFLALIAILAYLSVGVVIPSLASKWGVSTGLDFRNKFGEMNTFILDSLRGLEEIIQYDIGSQRLDSIDKKTLDLACIQKKLKHYEALTKVVTEGAVLIFSGLMLLAGLYLYQSQKLGFDGVVISTIAMMSSFGPVLALSSLSGNLRHTLASGDRVLDLFEELPQVEDNLDGRLVNFTSAEISNVSFGYNSEVIIKDYSLNIKKNSIIGLHGKSGSGKSTLLKLLMRFWDVDQGKILISNTNIKDIQTSSLRDNQAYVTQDTHMFNDTIANNIAIGKKDASIDEIISAAKKASIHNFITKLPDGYNSQVGELGDQLSCGERQRIGIARVFLRNAPLILLDEPTSNLDSLNEAIILKSLKEHSKNKTMVLVSHRKSTMNIADVVYSTDSERLS